MCSNISAITLFITCLIAAGTLLLVYVAWKQLSSLNQTNTETFLIKLKDAFFTKEARELLLLIDNELIQFKIIKTDNDEFGYFEVLSDSDLYKNMPAEFNNKLKFTTYEIDDYLLMHLEDLGIYLKKKIVTLVDVDELFGFYIECIGNNPEIKKYIEWARKEGEDDKIYEHFDELYEKLSN